MGAWSTSVTGNDTAADLKDEYTCAFYRYPQEEALQKIEAYVRGMFDESDPEEWCTYVYSLADFMWKKGILTDAVRARALQMIDSGFGLELWAESGEKVLRDRKKALEKFRTQIMSPMGAVKKIKPNVHTEDIFTAGDLIAIKLMTAGKTYGTKHAASDRRMTEEAFQSYDGKYILLQKAWSHVSWHSALVPEIGDHWAVFRLFDAVFDAPPADISPENLPEARFRKTGFPYFMCESSMFYFKRRQYQLLGNFPQPEPPLPPSERYVPDRRAESVNFGISNQWWDPDAQLLAAMQRS